MRQPAVSKWGGRRHHLCIRERSRSSTITYDATIHIIDDDRAIRDSLSELLTTEGYTVRTHASARTFLDAIRQDADGCVVTGVPMPDLHGFDLVGAMKERNLSMPIIVITAHAEVPTVVQVIKKGATNLLEKPFDGDALLACVRKALTRKNQDEARDAESRTNLARLATLTRREKQVLTALLEGRLNKVIAYELGISIRTVEFHRAKIMAKMKAKNLAELVRMALAVPREDMRSVA